MERNNNNKLHISHNNNFTIKPKQKIVTKTRKTKKNKNIKTIEEQYINNVLSGVTVTYNDGQMYKGTWNAKKEEPIDGEGVYISRSGKLILEGKFSKGKLTGKGKEIMKNDNDVEYEYEGEFNTVGDKHGHGKLITNGNTYIGEFRNDKINGNCQVIVDGVIRYEGNFYNNHFHGKGKYYFDDGSWYEGEFKDGKKNGKGIIKYPNNRNVSTVSYKDDHFYGWCEVIFNDQENQNDDYGIKSNKILFDGNPNQLYHYLRTYNNGATFIGRIDYANNQIYSGTGVLVDKKNGTILEGNFNKEHFHGTINGKNIYKGTLNDLKPHGKGKMKYDNGDEYEGEFKDGKPNGKGKMKYGNCDEYDGEFKDGKPHGKGKMKYGNGDVFEGEFLDGSACDKGKITYKNGVIYDGELKNGKPHGKGKLTYNNTTKIMNFVEGVATNEEENIEITINDKGLMVLYDKTKFLFISNENGLQYEGEQENMRDSAKVTITDCDGYSYKGSFQYLSNYEKQNKKIASELALYRNVEVTKGEQKFCGRWNVKKKQLDYGTGTMKYENGDIYDGEFEDGEPNGKGKMIYKNGDVYEGDFKHGDIYTAKSPINFTIKQFNDCTGKFHYDNGDEYEGDFKYGKPNGQGIMKYKNGDVFEGEFANGLACGKGKMKYKNGDEYDGEFKDGKPNGKGKMKYKNGDIYEGDFKHGAIYTPKSPINFTIKQFQNCKGKMKYENGDEYEGEFKDGKPNGKGKIKYEKNYYEYEGDFKDGKPNGKVKIKYLNDDVFEGEFFIDTGKMNGTIKYANGDVYEGELKDKNPIGKGKMKYENGDEYEGEFANGEPNGKGIMKYKNGDEYEGDFKFGKPYGIGIMKYKNGNVYEGEFANGAFANFLALCQGKMIYKNGDVYEGTFHFGEPYGKGIMKYKNGAICKGRWGNTSFNKFCITIKLNDEITATASFETDINNTPKEVLLPLSYNNKKICNIGIDNEYNITHVDGVEIDYNKNIADNIKELAKNQHLINFIFNKKSASTNKIYHVKLKQPNLINNYKKNEINNKPLKSKSSTNLYNVNKMIYKY